MNIARLELKGDPKLIPLILDLDREISAVQERETVKFRASMTPQEAMDAYVKVLHARRWILPLEVTLSRRRVGSSSRLRQKTPRAFHLDMEVIVTDRTSSTLSRASFTDQLHLKSRLRRHQHERLAEASTAGPHRNDILPLLELSYIPIADLRPSSRKVRKLDPAHVREVASAIAALGFCVPLLVGRGNEIINGEVRYEGPSNWALILFPASGSDI